VRTLGLLCFGVSCALLALSEFAQSQSSVWEHNGSTVYLSSKNTQRQFFYHKPRAGLEAGGVQSGTLLFSGRRIGGQYSGTAYIFSNKCGAVSYQVSGPVSPDDRIVTLYGKAPTLDEFCQTVAYRPDVLLLTLVTSSDQTAAANLDQTVERHTINEKWICIHPVFREEIKLKDRLGGTSARSEYVANAIIYLRSKYCRLFGGNVRADRTTHVGENCYQNSGLFRGERVYWGECLE
jgi:hypothetical protein